MDDRELNGLYLWKSLMKSGCEWHGDVFSKKWAECVIVPKGLSREVEERLDTWKDELDLYKIERDAAGEITCVWTA